MGELRVEERVSGGVESLEWRSGGVGELKVEELGSDEC